MILPGELDSRCGISFCDVFVSYVKILGYKFLLESGRNGSAKYDSII